MYPSSNNSFDLKLSIVPRRFTIALRAICLRFPSILFKFSQSTKQRSHPRARLIFLQNVGAKYREPAKGFVKRSSTYSFIAFRDVGLKTILSYFGHERRTDYVLKFYCASPPIFTLSRTVSTKFLTVKNGSANFCTASRIRHSILKRCCWFARRFERF